MPATPLVAAFLAGLQPGSPTLDAATLEGALGEAVSECQQTWPDVELSPGEFVHYLAERLTPAPDFGTSLRAACLTDLYLACGCALGRPAAVAALDSGFIKRLAFARFRTTGRVTDGEELVQRLRVRLLVASGEQPPRIASYSGRGPLSGWLRVTAARLAVDLRRAEPPAAIPAWAISGAAIDQELLYLKQAHAELFEATIKDALLALTKRSRTVLRLHFFEGVPLAQIALSYAVNARSVQRWIQAAQSSIIEHLRAVLAEKLELSSSQLESLMGAMQTEFVASLRQFFAAKV